MKIGEDYALGSVPGYRARVRLLDLKGDLLATVQPLDGWGSVAGVTFTTARTSLTVPWAEEAEAVRLKRLASADREYEQDIARSEKQRAIEKALPAFNGIMDISRALHVAADRDSYTVQIKVTDLLEVAERIRKLSMERQGATWINPINE